MTFAFLTHSEMKWLVLQFTRFTHSSVKSCFEDIQMTLLYCMCGFPDLHAPTTFPDGVFIDLFWCDYLTSHTLALLSQDIETQSRCTARSRTIATAHRTPDREDVVQYGPAIITTQLNETWHINTYTALDPSTLILRFATLTDPQDKVVIQPCRLKPKGAALWATVMD